MGNGLVRFVLWTVGIVGIVVAILRLWFVDIVVVSDEGMIPTIMPGDMVAVWRRADPGLGDVTICQNPQAAGFHVVSRVLGLPGDTVEILGDQRAARTGEAVSGVASQPPRFAINRRPVDYDLLGVRDFADPATGRPRQFRHAKEMLGNNPHDIYGDPQGRFWIRPTRADGGFFLLGDNRTTHPYDSRTFGVAPAANCHGIVFMRLKPGPVSAPEVPHGAMDMIR